MHYRNSVDYRRKKLKKYFVIFITLLIVTTGLCAWVFKKPSVVSNAIHKPQLIFNQNIGQGEQSKITKTIQDQKLSYSGVVNVDSQTGLENTTNNTVLSVYVPITNFNSTRQDFTKTDFTQVKLFVPTDTDAIVKQAIAQQLGLQADKLQSLSGPVENIDESAVAMVPFGQVSTKVKMLRMQGSYYLDDFVHGAIFRTLSFSGGDSGQLDHASFDNLPNKDSVLKINMTGVTALTRVMINKLQSVKDSSYFADKIGSFLSDADITHVSNEVSFKPDCTYSNTSFCAPPGMINALKAIGVDVVELTGNHNNDQGNIYNTQSINLYHSLGWKTFGGGLNNTEAAKPYVVDQKKSKITFLGYNDADSPNSGVIATADHAGGNHLDLDQAAKDISNAKAQNNFVVVDVQFPECYSYPDGFVEFPSCDSPINNQQERFHQLIDAGADMVIGTQAHQPQTYELYKNKPIYYGLGNLYFEQTQWPGTERGIILTHYFIAGKLIQTKLTPTIYDGALQTHISSDKEAAYLLKRLHDAR